MAEIALLRSIWRRLPSCGCTQRSGACDAGIQFTHHPARAGSALLPSHRSTVTHGTAFEFEADHQPA